MTRARYQQVSLQDTPYYHCISRCVRRAYLCGEDPVSGKNFDHRKQWLVTHIKQLAAQFSVEICAYAVMSNHYHLVLYVNQSQAEAWTDAEVINRWTALFPRNGALLETLLKNKTSRAAQRQLQKSVSLWRQRLVDISWFMRCLNETLARAANKEDECTGRFWEGRFKSQALLDDKALVTCMAYVDLNPVRARLSESLEGSDFTSIQERLIRHAMKVKHRSYRQHRLLTRRASKHLVGRRSKKQAKLKALASQHGSTGGTLPLTQKSYFDLLDTTCKILVAGDRLKPENFRLLEQKHQIFQKLGIHAESWLRGATAFHKYYSVAAGSEQSLLHFHRRRIKLGVDLKHPHKWIRGVQSARLLYGT